MKKSIFPFAALHSKAKLSFLFLKWRLTAEWTGSLNWRKQSKKIIAIFSSYNPYELLESLICASLWLPNVSSQMSHAFLTSLALSIEEKRYSGKEKIKSYQDFQNLIKQLYELMPTFPAVEDYVPEPDWGEIRFPFQENNYQIFYGVEIERIYDFLTAFKMLYVADDKYFLEKLNRSPSEELTFCLRLQDCIISNLKQNVTKEALTSITSGAREVPSEHFWRSFREFSRAFNPEKLAHNKTLLGLYTATLGNKKSNVSPKKFVAHFMGGQALPFFLVKVQGCYLPFLPRRLSTVLVEEWSREGKTVLQNDEIKNKIFAHCEAKIFKFIKARINADEIFPLASALKEDGRPDEIVYATIVLQHRKLMPVYLLKATSVDGHVGTALEELSAKIDRSIELLSRQPLTFALHLDRKNVELRPTSEKLDVEIHPIVIILNTSTATGHFIKIPKNAKFTPILLDNFCTLFDEVGNIAELIDFFKYRESEERIHTPMIGIVDQFAAYKDSSGVLVAGAREPNWIGLDPHRGSNFRFENLKIFWELYPKENYFDDPRAWTVKKESDSRVRLEAKGYFGSSLFTRIQNTNVFFTSPFEKMSFELAQISNLLMECLEDVLARVKENVQDLNFFRKYRELNVIFFPDSLLKDSEFSHLAHLAPAGNFWKSDTGWPRADIPGIRIVYNHSKLSAELMQVKDNSVELKLLYEFLDSIHRICHDEKTGKIKKAISQKLRGGRPRFKFFEVQLGVDFPQFVNPLMPDTKHAKLARKRVAEIVMALGLLPGKYSHEDAKVKINQMRDGLVAEINKLVANYDLKMNLPFLITRIDGLLHHWEREERTVEHAADHEVDYRLDERHSELKRKYIIPHKNYRYLIEKFVQINPAGKEKLREDDFKYLISLIDNLHILYGVSDHLHYGLYLLQLEITDDFLFKIANDEKYDRQENEFMQERSAYSLGLLGKPADRVKLPMNVKELLEKFDVVFYEELGFSLQNLGSVCAILATWALRCGLQEPQAYNSSTLERIVKICRENLEFLKDGETERIINFLTLEGELLLNKLSVDEEDEGGVHPDLPVWEIAKRPQRYTLKPLIRVKGDYFWGPHSLRRTAVHWLGRLHDATLPVRMRSEKIDAMLRIVKKQLEDTVVNKTFEIVGRFTKSREKNLYLHKRDPGGKHPESLGDFDILAYLPGKNILLNIECKDLLQAHCLKDSKTLREKILGKPTKRGAFQALEERYRYLTKNAERIFKILNWHDNNYNEPEVISLFVTRHLEFWAKYPPEAFSAKFCRVDALEDFISGLKDYELSSVNKKC